MSGNSSNNSTGNNLRYDDSYANQVNNIIDTLDLDSETDRGILKSRFLSEASSEVVGNSSSGIFCTTSTNSGDSSTISSTWDTTSFTGSCGLGFTPPTMSENQPILYF